VLCPYIYIYREYGDADIKEIKLMSKGRKKYETVGTLHFGSIRYCSGYMVRMLNNHVMIFLGLFRFIPCLIILRMDSMSN